MSDSLPFENIVRQVLVKQYADTDPAFGRYPLDRTAEQLIQCGIVNLDKPAGITSRDAADLVGRILNVRKTGHGGTLDPAVTGVLPVALGRATRIVQIFLPAGKEYICRMQLHRDVSRPILESIFKEFTGTVVQTPPVKSAVKRQPRERQIYYMNILKIQGRDVSFRVGCQGGTYIRKLVHDMGLRLGGGAHMSELRRTKAGLFDISDSNTIAQLEETYSLWKNSSQEAPLKKIVLPVEVALTALPKVWIDDFAVEPLCSGYPLTVPGIIKLHDNIAASEMVAVVTLKDELVALGNALLNSGQMLDMHKGLAVNIHKVFMQPGTYGRRG